MIKISVVVFFILSSCSSIQQDLDPKIFYQRDLVIKVSDDTITGMGVIPFKKNYVLKIKSPGDMSLLILETCHRSIEIEGAGKREKYEYVPAKGIEDQPNCATIKFSSFERGIKGRHAEGVLVMENPSFTLPATVKCNGESKRYGGTSVCHSKEYLYHEISFDEPVNIFETKCSLESPNGVTNIRFAMHSRDCRFIFKAADGRKHIMYTSGYEQILIRN